MVPYLLLGLFALLAPITAVGFYFLEKTAFHKLNYWIKQIIFGVGFGIIAVLCTEFGVQSNGAVLNVRDSAPIIAGLCFGWPAGLISGFIGGFERFLSAFWKGTYYTQLACSISTFISGASASLLHFVFFRKRRPTWYQGLLIGAVLETSHILMIFVTNMTDTTTAFSYVSKIGNPMIIGVAISVGLGVGLIQLFSHDWRAARVSRHNWRISTVLQLSLFGAVLFAYGAMFIFTFDIQSQIAENNAKNTLINDAVEVTNDVQDRADENLLNLTRQIAENLETRNSNSEIIDNSYLLSLITPDLFGGVHFEVSEINIIDENGIIVISSDSRWVDEQFDMKNNGPQPREFYDHLLVNGEEEYVQAYRKIGADNETDMKYAGKDLSFSGFVQVGYNSTLFYKNLEDTIEKTVRNKRVGENGFIIVTDFNGNLVTMTEASDTEHEITDFQYDGDTSKMEMLKVYRGTVKIGGEINKIHFLSQEKEAYYITAVMLDSEILFAREMSIYVATYEQFIIFGIIYWLSYGIIQHYVLRDLDKVNTGLKEITEGNLNVVLDSHNSKDFGELNGSINETVKTLKAINEKEMENAKAIQMGALPPNEAYYDIHDFDIYAEMVTAKVVGGDFYDYFPLNNNCFVILIADVSGKGIPAALFMMRTKTLIKSLLETGMSVEEAIKHTNMQLCTNNEAKMFVTCWIGVVHYDTGVVEYVNAGHNPPLIKHNGKYEYLKSVPNLVLGGLSRAPYQRQLFKLSPGDVILLYTDGITEAKNSSSSMYGEQRLLDYVNKLATIDPQKICENVLNDNRDFVGEYEQSDDITLLTFSYYGFARHYRYEYDGVISNFAKAKEDLSIDLKKENIPQEIINKTLVCYDEIFSNSAKYAYAKKKGKIYVSLDITPEQLALTISDYGEPFNPLEKADPDITTELKDRKIGGLGIYMVKNFMDKYHYYYQNNKNVLILQKYLKNKDGGNK